MGRGSSVNNFHVMGKKILLYSYRMVADTGFAPNPYFGVLSLATCKPGMRGNASIGRELNAGNDVWIAGWVTSHVTNVPLTGRELIWLGRVTKQISIADYWENYPDKRPVPQEQVAASAQGCSNNAMAVNAVPTHAGNCNACETAATLKPEHFGDNIYSPDPSTPLGYRWHPNNFHEDWNTEHDVSGKNVLLCEEFYYFGHEDYMKPVPEELLPDIPKNQSRYGSKTLDDRAAAFINYAKAQPCFISHLSPIPKK